MTEVRPRVVYWFDIPTPTPIARCNAVADLGLLDFEVWFSRRTHGDAWQVWGIDERDFRFRYRYTQPTRFLGQSVLIPFANMRASRPDLIVHDYLPWYLAVGVLASKASARRTALRVLPTFDPRGERTRFGQLSMHFIFRSVDGAKVPGPDGAEYAARYGIPKVRTATVAQTIDASRFAPVASMRSEGRRRLRDALGVSGCTFVCVGRLLERKGLTYLFEAYRAVCDAYPDVSLVLVGDGPDEGKYRALAATLPNVVFAGWVSEEKVPEYFAVADVVVFPTLGDAHGLVVEEAMAAGKPVISSDRAGDILLRLKGRGGFVVPARNSAALAEKMLLLARDSNVRRDMSARAFATAAHAEHSRYAHDFVGFVEKMLSLPPRKSRAARQATLAGRVMHAVAARGNLLTPDASVPARADTLSGARSPRERHTE